MKTKQTPLEWFIEQLEQKGGAWVNLSIGTMQISIKEEEYIDLINQAKAMEKEQIKKAYKDFHDLGHIYGLDLEKYYNETYGNKTNS